MKYMGWGYQDLRSLPHEYYYEAVRIMEEESARIDNAGV
jgi:hypothetical protein